MKYEIYSFFLHLSGLILLLAELTSCREPKSSVKKVFGIMESKMMHRKILHMN